MRMLFGGNASTKLAGMQGLFMPWDHKTELATGGNAEHTLTLLNALNHLACNDECAVGSGGATVGYKAHGTATDYMHEVLGVPIPMTWEIYGDETVHFQDCFRMFNPVSKQQFDRVVERWSNALFRTMLLAEQHPAVERLGLRALEAAPVARQAADTDRDEASVDSLQGAARRLPPGSDARWGAGKAARAVALGGQPVQARGLYQPGQALAAGGALFAVTVVLWCIMRRFLRNARTRKRVSAMHLAAAGDPDRRE